MKSKPLVAIFRFTLLEVLRTKLWLFVVALIGVLVALAEFTASLAITESVEYRIISFATMARLIAVLTISLFVCNSVIRDFEDGVFDLLISRPVSRGVWYFSKLAGYLVAAFLLACLTTLPLIYFGADYPARWWLALFAELSIVTAAALAFASTMRNATTAVTAVLAFYLLSRVISVLVLMSRRAADDLAQTINRLLAYAVEGLAYLLPDVSRFASPEILISEMAELNSSISLSFIGAQTLIYVVLLSCVGLIDLYRRNS